MEKIIRLQDSKYKYKPNNNNETSIFIEQSIAEAIGLNDGEKHTFQIDKENILKALTFTFSFKKPLFRKNDKVALDSDWLEKEYEKIKNHFQISSEYKVDVSTASGNRFYLNSLVQPSGFNIRNIFIQDHFKLIFSKTNNDLRIDYSHESYDLDDDKNDLLNEPKVTYGQGMLFGESSEVEIISSNKTLRRIIYESYLYVRGLVGENQILSGYELKDSKINDRNYKGLTLPKYFNYEVLIGLFSEEQTKDNLKSSDTIRFIDETIKTLDYDNSYFTSQWNESIETGLSLSNFNVFLKDISKNTLEIIKDNDIYKLVKKRGFNRVTQNKIFYGAPGTGKSHKVEELTRIHEVYGRVERVTFHPEYDYASFVGGYKPTMSDDNIRYEFVPQAFTNIYVNAWNDLNNDYYLIIEEINRGNCAEIFGDIFQLLDRTNYYKISPSKELKEYLEIELNGNPNIDSDKLLLPPNLNILATMNTSDQSLFPMDSAFKRRWDWEYIPINYDYSENNGSSKFKVQLSESESFSWLKFIESVNDLIKTNENLGMDKCIGNYFIKPVTDLIGFELFINKVIFYLWNDVFKDETDDNSIFKDKTTYEDFFPVQSNGINKVKEILEILKIEINTD